MLTKSIHLHTNAPSIMDTVSSRSLFKSNSGFLGQKRTLKRSLDQMADKKRHETDRMISLLPEESKKAVKGKIASTYKVGVQSPNYR